ncbi:hypothetical protein GDO81_027664 [Engystomops pustulosus]|uniref:Uncharacterized protein n=1 Tax=Engystomops pustulosus TaxID=76066 RepID=A0AAV6YFK1_ENGPU|nr:hypothetical protein GDO81_027664 [Engystomops pustulosus]
MDYGKDAILRHRGFRPRHCCHGKTFTCLHARHHIGSAGCVHRLLNPACTRRLSSRLTHEDVRHTHQWTKKMLHRLMRIRGGGGAR